MQEREIVAGMSAFVASVDSGSFSAAARRTGLTPSAVSKLVSRLERRLGVRLLVRTTRTMTLTEAGTAFFHRARMILDEVRSVEREAASRHEEPRGLLRVSSTAAFGHLRVLPIALAFQRKFPDVTLALDLSDRITDLYSDPVDVAIRITGEPPLSLVARKVGEDRRLLCASPAYLRRRPAPNTAADLRQHDCVIFTGRRGAESWKLRVRPGGEETISLTVPGRLRLSNILSVYEAAIAGFGIADLPDYLVADALREGRLVSVLEPLVVVERSIYVLHVPSPFVPATIREFVRHAATKLGKPAARAG